MTEAVELFKYILQPILRTQIMMSDTSVSWGLNCVKKLDKIRNRYRHMLVRENVGLFFTYVEAVAKH